MYGDGKILDDSNKSHPLKQDLIPRHLIPFLEEHKSLPLGLIQFQERDR